MTTDARGLSLGEGLRPFDGHSTGAQVGFLAGGVALWLVVFVPLARALDGANAARNATAVASAVAGMYFAAGFTRGYGGPALSFLYPVAVTVVLPHVLGWLPVALATTVAAGDPAFGLYKANPAWVWDSAVAALPGVAVFAVLVVAWMRSLTPAEERAFATAHLPDAWLRLRE